MTQQFVNLKARGLYTHPNPFSEVPPGGLLQADNVVIDREGLIETRRGFEIMWEMTPTPAAPIRKFCEFGNNNFIYHDGTNLFGYPDSAVTFQYSGSYSKPSTSQTIRDSQANNNLYFTTSTGVKKITSVNSSILPESAGMYKGMDGFGAVSGASGFMATNSAVAYRITWGIKDANSNKIIGSPSSRFIVTNTTGGTRNVDINFSIPSGITTSHIFQVFRSFQTATSTEEPSDELQLVIESSPTSTNITNGYVTYTDMTPDNLLGTVLYSNPSQETILQANDAPPIARDITFWKNQMFYAGTATKHRMTMTIISVGASLGVQVNDTIVIAGTTYTGKAAETIASREFQVFTGGTPAQNIDDTAKSLIRVINRNTSNTTVYAYYLTGYADLPGKILIEERGLGGSSFSAYSSRGGAFSPPLPSSGTTYASANDLKLNRIYISKYGQPEAVPILNYLDIGSNYDKILRIIPLRDSLFIFKDNEGVFRITGETINDFRVSLFDGSTKLICNESAQIFNNSIFMLTDQGVASVSDAGTQIMSRPIEKDIVPLREKTLWTLGTYCFAFSYESERKYILALYDENTYSTGYPSFQFVYNAATDTWTKWTIPMSAGFVFNGSDRILFASPSAVHGKYYLMKERKYYDKRDFVDFQVGCPAFVDQGGTLFNEITLSSTAGINIGDYVVAINNDTGEIAETLLGVVPYKNYPEVCDFIARITDKLSGNRIVIEPPLVWIPIEGMNPPSDNISYYIASPIDSRIKFVPIHSGNPTLVHNFKQVAVAFDSEDFSNIDITYYPTNLSGTTETVTLQARRTSTDSDVIPTYVPKEKSKANWLNIGLNSKQAYDNFGLGGIVVYYDVVGMSQR